MKLRSLFVLVGIIILSVVMISRTDLGGSNSDVGRLAVITRCYGVNADEIEQLITIPIERAFTEIHGIEDVSAYSEFSTSRVDLRVSPNADFQRVSVEVREKTERTWSAISARMPAVQKPQIVTSGTDQQAVFSAALSLKGVSLIEMRRIAEQKVKPLYSSIDGLGEIDISGGSVSEIHAAVDPQKAAAYGYGASDVAAVIQNADILSSCGFIDDGIIRMPVSFDARLNTIKVLQNLPVSTNLRLSDIADVYYSSREKDNISRFNNDERIGIYIKCSQPNLISISKRIREVTAGLEQQGFTIEVINDRGAELEEAFRSIIKALIIGIIASALILLIFKTGRRRLLFLTAGQPVIMLTALGAAASAGFSPDHYLLAGFAVGTGMTLDSALLITAALDKHADSWRTILKPLTSSVLTSLIALLPVMSLRDEIPGLAALITALAIILVCALLLSAFFLPGLYGKGRRNKRQRKQQTSQLRILASSRRRLFRAARGMYAGGNISRMVFPLYAAVTVAGVLCLVTMNLRINNPLESPVVFSRFEVEAGESPISVDAKMNSLLNGINELTGIISVQSIARRGGGSVTVRFDEEQTDRESLVSQMKSICRRIQGGFLYFPQGESDDKTMLRVSVTGPEPAELKRISRAALTMLLKDPSFKEGILHFKDDTPALHFIPDADALAEVGITTAQAASFLRWNVQGPVAVKWQSAGTERDLRVMSTGRSSLNPSSLGALKLPSPSGESFFRLDQLGDIVEAGETIRINRLNMQHAESFSVICEGDNPVDLQNRIWNILDEVELPEGYIFIPSTELIEKQQLYRRLWIQFGLAIVLIFFVLCIERESLKQPLIIIAQLPPILAVPLIVLKLTGAALGTETIIGLILLSGMGINNGILILDNISEGIGNALKMRFNGLFLTTATSIAGMIPLLFTGNTFFINIAVVLISGLTASFLVSIFIFPTLMIKYRKQDFHR